MRAMLERVLPGVESRAGSAEAVTPSFKNFERRAFSHADAVIGAPAGHRADALADARVLVGDGTIDFPMRTMTIVADRA